MILIIQLRLQAIPIALCKLKNPDPLTHLLIYTNHLLIVCTENRPGFTGRFFYDIYSIILMELQKPQSLHCLSSPYEVKTTKQNPRHPRC